MILWDSFHRHLIPEDLIPRGGGGHPRWKPGFRPSHGGCHLAGDTSVPGASVYLTQWFRLWCESPDESCSATQDAEQTVATL